MQPTGCMQCLSGNRKSVIRDSITEELSVRFAQIQPDKFVVMLNRPIFRHLDHAASNFDVALRIAGVISQ
jgi:hypothetical protein